MSNLTFVIVKIWKKLHLSKCISRFTLTHLSSCIFNQVVTSFPENELKVQTLFDPQHKHTNQTKVSFLINEKYPVWPQNSMWL